MAAPKGNRFALGHGFGRPAIYETADEMWKVACEYFEIETGSNGVCKPTISGLIFHLGFASRNQWYVYKEKNDDFKYTINYLQKFIESCYEKNLHGFAYAGSIFALKNLNPNEWRDEVIQHQTTDKVNASFGTAIQPPQESRKDTQ